MASSVRKPIALRRARLDEPLGLEDAQDLARDRRADRRVRVREAVDERPGTADCVVDSAGSGHEAERPVAGGRALGGDEDVRSDAPVVEPEPAAGPAEPGHDLVGDEQDPMGPADLGDRRPIALRRLHGRERRPDDRFGDKGGDRVGSRGGDQAIEL